MDKVVTTIILSIMCGIIAVIFKEPLTLKNNELVIRKINLLLIIGYAIVIGYVFIANYCSDKRPSLFTFFFMMTFCLTSSFPLQILKVYKYNGPVNLLIIAMNLTTMAAIHFYRLDLFVTSGVMTKITGVSSFPVAVSFLIFSEIALAVLTFLLASKKLQVIFDWIEKSSRSWMWGSASLILIILPVLAGVKTGRSNLGLIKSSVQTANFIFLIIFVLSIAKILSSQEHMLRLDVVSPLTRLKAFVHVLLYSSSCFIVPMILFQRELGIPLLMFCFILVMLTFTSQKWFIFPFGISGIILFITAIMIFSTHVQARIIGSWLNWRDWAFAAYDGTNSWTGWQPFQALSGVKASNIWGTGITAGHPNIYSITNDFAAVGICEEWGIFGLAIIVSSFFYIIYVSFRCFIAPDFKGLTMLGLSVALLLEGFFNLSGNLSILPITGTPLPFISNSGSTILCSYIALAIMMFLQDNREREH